MILSSADILRILGGSEIIRLSARIKITDQKPALSGDDQLLIYISRFPSVAEFEATWTLWLEGDGETELVAAEIKRLLPKVQVQSGLITTLTTTDFRSEHTQTAPEAAKPQKAQIDTSAFEERFQSLQEDIEDRMLLISSGRNGQDGKDGAAGRDGRDGKDIDATQTELFDLKDVDSSLIPLEAGQVLTWDGQKWTNLYVRTSSTIGGGGGGGGGTSDVKVLNDLEDVTTEGVADGQFLRYSESAGQWQTVTVPPGSDFPEAPTDGRVYGRGDSSWVALVDENGQPLNPGTGGGLDKWTEDDQGNLIPDTVNQDLGSFATTVDSVWANTVYNMGNTLYLNSKPLTVDQATDDLYFNGQPVSIGSHTRFINDLYDVDTTGVEVGETLVWDGNYWVPGEATGGGGIEEAPQDGNFYVRQDGQWINLSAALFALDSRIVDGGDFLKGMSAGDDETVDGGSFS